MPPIPVSNESVEAVSESVSSSVERSVAKAAGGVLGFIAGNLPGAIVGYNLGDIVYSYRGQPVKVLAESSRLVKVPVVNQEYLGIGYEPSLGKVAELGIEWGKYFVQPKVGKRYVSLQLDSGSIPLSYSRGREYKVRRRRKRRFINKF